MLDLGSDVVDGWVAQLGDLAGPTLAELGDADRVDLLRSLEELKNAAAGAQAALAVVLDSSQRAAQAEAGVPARRLGEGVAAQVGLARRESPHKAARLLGLAAILHAEMPHTLALLRAGLLTEWRATIMARETACLALADRQEIDRRLCGQVLAGESHPVAVGLSDKALGAAAYRIAAELDAAALTERARRAVNERHVTIRPAPDLMAHLSALVPMKEGVAVYAALRAAADTARNDPEDCRGRGQVMADTLVERVTGASVTDPADLEVTLVMTDRTLFETADDPAHLPGYGAVPARWARELIHSTLGSSCGGAGSVSGSGTKPERQAKLWVRRLYTCPTTGAVVAMDSRRRLAPAGLAGLVTARDQGLCRTPWCGAPLRTIDHAEEHRLGGATSELNHQGLCERCNLAKQAPGWTARAVSSPWARHTVVTTTPTGHQHRSRAPARPGHRDPLTSPEPVGEATRQRSGYDLTG